jgi:hypothetical protein
MRNLCQQNWRGMVLVRFMLAQGFEVGHAQARFGISALAESCQVIVVKGVAE